MQLFDFLIEHDANPQAQDKQGLQTKCLIASCKNFVRSREVPRAPGLRQRQPPPAVPIGQTWGCIGDQGTERSNSTYDCMCCGAPPRRCLSPTPRRKPQGLQFCPFPQSLYFPPIPQLVDQDGFTPLHWACTHESSSCAALLIQMGADLNACPPPACFTPLHLACRVRFLNVFELPPVLSRKETVPHSLHVLRATPDTHLTVHQFRPTSL